ncbi:MAG: ATP-binding cassette domain-containing protein, partial [Bacilli bacterium]|nr:ATP-binding cassette domain-containing protein [Bacilli bacterium]
QNLEFVLKIINVSPEEIDKRIEYALTAVGMYKYRKRKPHQLSGGQQQRVAIARALVKSPNVVVADEPTGNLDEKNKTQIMNIIKKISAECLVVLVTHERRLAEFYGDIIVELVDGAIISSHENRGEAGELSTRDDRNIYLPEYKQKEIINEDLSIKYFYQDRPVPLKLNLIYQNGSYYLYSETEQIEIKIIDSRSEVKVIDTPRPVLKQENWRTFDYSLPPLDPEIRATGSAIKYKDTLKMAWRELGKMRRGQKFLLTILVFAAVMVVYAFITLFSSIRVEERDFLYDNRNLVEVKGTEEFTVEDYYRLKEELQVDYILGPANRVSLPQFEFKYFFQYQDRDLSAFPSHSILPVDVYNLSAMLIEGRLPENRYEAVIDKYLIDIMLKDPAFMQIGARYLKQFNNLNWYRSNVNGKIVGIVDTGNPNIYLRMEDYREFMINSYAAKEEYRFTAAPNTTVIEYYPISDWKKTNPALVPFDYNNLAADEIIVSASYLQYLESKNEEPVTKVQFDKEYRIIGFIYDDVFGEVIVNNENLERLLYHFIDKNPAVFTKNKKAMIERLKGIGLKGKDTYKTLYLEYYTYNFSFTEYSFSLVILAASLLFLYFLMRSSLIKRIYEVGVYRALGVKKTNVYRLFLSEIIVLTLITSTIGIIITSYIIDKVNNLSPYELIYYPWYIPVVSFIFIFAVNVLTGMLPVISLLRNTPAQILSKYDI